MQVILTKEVLGLGDPGEVVTVKNGYGRNYLLPRKMALEATKKNLASVEAERVRIMGQQAREAEKVQGDADALSGVAVTIKARAGETGKLYGSVTNMDVAAALAAKGFDIDRRRILMDGPIKSLGAQDLRVKLHPQVVVEIKVTVEPDAPIEPKAPAEPQEAEEAASEEAQAQDAAPEEPQAEDAEEAAEAEETAKEE
jgi:large subunit ribosomal protein L9